MHTNHSKVAFFAGLSLGYLLAIFIPQNQRKQQKRLVQDNAALLSKLLTDPNERERVQRIFGKNTKKFLNQYQQIREKLVDNLSQHQGGIQLIDKEKYTKVVSDIITDLKSQQIIDPDKLNLVKEFLIEDFQLLTTPNSTPDKTTAKS